MNEPERYEPTWRDDAELDALLRTAKIIGINDIDASLADGAKELRHQPHSHQSSQFYEGELTMLAVIRPKIMIGAASLGLLGLLGGSAAASGSLAGSGPFEGAPPASHVAALSAPHGHGAVPRQWEEAAPNVMPQG